MQLIDDILEKNYRDMKKAAEDRSVWRTTRRDCHKLKTGAFGEQQEETVINLKTGAFGDQ